jgi:hypothetical protein
VADLQLTATWSAADMSNILQQVRDAFAETLQQRPDLAFQRRVSFLRPIKHYFIGSMFDGRGGVRVRTRWNVWQLYGDGSGHMLATFSDHVPFKHPYHDFNGDGSLDAEWCAAVVAKIDSLSWIRDHDSFLEFMDVEYEGKYPAYRMPVVRHCRSIPHATGCGHAFPVSCRPGQPAAAG